MSDCDDTVCSASLSRPTTTRRTYGKARQSIDDGPSMTFAPTKPTGSVLGQPPTEPFKWRQSLVNLGAAADTEATEAEVQAARERFRLEGLAAKPAVQLESSCEGYTSDSADVSIAPKLDAFSSSTLTEISVSTSTSISKPQTDPVHETSPGALGSHQAVPWENDDDVAGVVSDTGSPLSERQLAARASPTLSQEDDLDRPMLKHSTRTRPRVKGIRKMDSELAHRDAARALRDRPAGLSRPNSAQRPVSQWLTNAQSVASIVATAHSPHPGTSPEDIRQFTPSSVPHHDASAHSNDFVVRGEGRRQSSSPTPQPNNFRHVPSRHCDEDNDHADSLTLDDALNRKMEQQNRQKRLAALKAEAVKAQASRLGNTDVEEDVTILPSAASPRPDQAGKGGRASTGEGQGLAARTANALPLKASPVAEGKVMTTDRKHRQSAGYKHFSGAARRATAKPAHDGLASQSQLHAHLSAQHFMQARKIAQRKEELFGPSKHLPAKNLPDAVIAVPTSHSSDLDSDESDSDFIPHSDDDPLRTEQGGSQSSVLAAHEGPERGSAFGNEDKENRPIVPVRGLSPDGDEDGPVRQATFRRGRIVTVSDDEYDETVLKPVTKTMLEESSVSRSFHDGEELAGFGSGNTSFSQLFAETQVPNGPDMNGLAGMRDNVPQGLVPSGILLPSVVMSESQKRRDNALIAAELAHTQSGEKRAEHTGNYLNSQGFFTQTRPADFDPQALPTGVSSTQHTATCGTDKQLSPLIGSAQNEESSANVGRRDDSSPTLENGEPLLTRLRSRHERSMINDSTETHVPPARKRNAFEVLNANAARQTSGSRHTGSALIDVQAEESDDEGGWGLMATADDEDEEDGDNPGYVPDLLDDTAVDDSTLQNQSILAAEKHREVEQADDAQREAEAKKVTEGYYRHKRRGKDFLSDEEDDDGRPRHLSKKQRRQRKLDREDGLFKLGGEENVFLEAYEQDLESDNEFEESPLSPAGIASPEHKLSAHERLTLLRKRAQMNTGSTLETFADKSDAGPAQFSIGRAFSRTAVSSAHEVGVESKNGRSRADSKAEQFETTTSASSSTRLSSLSKFVSEESLNPRRSGGTAVSVVVQKHTSVSHTAHDLPVGNKPGRQLGRQASGSILLERSERFGL